MLSHQPQFPSSQRGAPNLFLSNLWKAAEARASDLMAPRLLLLEFHFEALIISFHSWFSLGVPTRLRALVSTIGLCSAVIYTHGSKHMASYHPSPLLQAGYPQSQHIPETTGKHPCLWTSACSDVASGMSDLDSHFSKVCFFLGDSS